MFKAFNYLLLLTSFTFLAVPYQGQADPNPCAAVSRFTEEEPHCSGFDSCPQAERVQITCEIRQTLLDRYAPIAMKEKRLTKIDGTTPFNVREHLDQCVETEKALPNDNDNLKFSDRIRLCLSGLQDTHLNINTVVPMPPVYVGLMLLEVNGKLIISQRNEKNIQLTQKISGMDDYSALLAIGNEVVSIDGLTPEEEIKRLTPYVRESSPQATRISAVESITARRFLYPTKSRLTLAIKTETDVRTVNIPWFVHKSFIDRHDTRDYFRRLNFAETDLLNWRYDKLKHEWVPSGDDMRGYKAENSILPKAEQKHLETFLDESEDPAVRMGEIITPSGVGVCYLQLLTFLPTKLKQEGSDEAVDYLTPIKDFIKETCQAKGLQLILDLRANGGGNGGYPPTLLSILSPANAAFKTVARAYRVSYRGKSIIEQMLFQSSTDSAWSALELGENVNPITSWEAYQKAYATQQKYTEIIGGTPITAHSKVGGYDGKIVALVTPQCISACDMTAALLQRNQRATLIGTSTNGTGAGYRSTDSLSETWKDSDNFFSIKIPNFIFGVLPEQPAAGEIGLPFEKFMDTAMLENRPSVAEEQYQLTLNEILGKETGWYKKALEVLGLNKKTSIELPTTTSTPPAEPSDKSVDK